ncbi:MAG: type II toxin-antitoxin system HicB family antitoxin [Pyrinomonadaceae bacterium]
MEKIYVLQSGLQELKQGFSVNCPGLPGCWSQGATEEEALENIKEAIREYLEVVNDLTRSADVREVEIAA